jgi:hypothetical protein
MKPSGWIAVFCGAALLGGLPLAAQAPSILEPKVERHEGPPLWISAEAVADAEKIVNLDLVDSLSLRKRVERELRELGEPPAAEKTGDRGKPEIVKIPPSQCKFETYMEDYQAGAPSGDLRSLAGQSRSIVRGRLRAVELGFTFGTPSSLLEVEVTEVIKGNAPKSPFYVDYPVARFKIGPLHFCNANRGFEPQPGDEILFFDAAGPTDRKDILYVPRMDQIFFQSPKKTLFLPPHLKDTEDLKGASSLVDVIARLRSKGLLTLSQGQRLAFQDC